MDCCGPDVDNDYLSALFSTLSSTPIGVGSKLLALSSAGALGYSTREKNQSRFTRLSNLACATATLVDATWTAEDIDTLGLLVPTTATLTIPAGAAGLYTVTFRGTWSGAATTRNGCALTVAGTVATAAHVAGVYSRGGDVGASDIGATWADIPLGVNDTMKVSVIQSSGSSRDLNPATLLVSWGGT